MKKLNKILLWPVMFMALGWGGYKFIEAYSSYGPFEVVIDTGDRQLEDVIVVMAMHYYKSHGMGATYKEVRFGNSNEPIRFPRGWVSFWAKEPVMKVTVYHPSIYGRTLSLDPPLKRFHRGVWRFQPLRVLRWEELVAKEVAEFEHDPSTLASRMTRMLYSHFGSLTRNYVSKFPPDKRHLLKNHIAELRETFYMTPADLESQNGKSSAYMMEELISEFRQEGQ